MDFLGLGGGEILLILIVAVIIFGPGKIPEIARGLGKAVNSFKAASTELTSAVTREIEEVKKTQEKPPAPAATEPARTDSAGPTEPADPGANI